VDEKSSDGVEGYCMECPGPGQEGSSPFELPFIYEKLAP